MAKGIKFREIMSGKVAGSSHFGFDLNVEILDLDSFRRGARHRAVLAGGKVDWQDPRVNKARRQKLRALPGTVDLFRTDRRVLSKKYFDFAFSFRDANNELVKVTGTKVLFDDSGFDAARDLATVFIDLSAGNSVFASGTVQVHIGEFITQMMTLEALGSNAREQDQARREFNGFMNHQLREIYKHIPLIFRDNDRLSREEWRALRLCAEVMLPQPLPSNGPSIDDVVKSLEKFMAHASRERVEAIRFWLQQFGLIAQVDRREIAKIRGFIAKELRRSERSLFRDVFELLHLMVVLPYYSHRKADKLVGYVRPNVKAKRDSSADLKITKQPPDREFDYVVAGSGVAGSLIAARLAAKRKSVLLLEAGPYVPERKIESDELMSVARLYQSSGLQRVNDSLLTADPGFLVLQGRCVGGGGLVNNAVCFKMPKSRQQDWRNVGFPISEPALRQAYDTVAAELSIGPVGNKAKHLNPASVFLNNALNTTPTAPNPGDYPGPGLHECLVNLKSDCQSFGLCNLGCGAGKKTNSLQVHLRKAVRSGFCTLVPNATAVRLVLKGSKVEGLEVRVGSDPPIRVRAKEYVLSCGPIGSSAVLLRTPGIGRLKLPIGKRFSANVGSPVFAFGNSVLHPRASVQIAHYYWPPAGQDGFVIESWFNPPGSNALTMPGFFNRHYYRMQQYNRSVGAAPLVGTEAKGRVKVDLAGNPVISLPIRKPEIQRLRAGLTFLSQKLLDGGAEAVLTGFGNGFEMYTAADVALFDRALQKLETNAAQRYKLKIGTGHPQGGNAMSSDPAIGVVDEDFRVRGLDNLRVCDGSIFPESSGVNPQWTIFALAELCAAKLD